MMTKMAPAAPLFVVLLFAQEGFAETPSRRNRAPIDACPASCTVSTQNIVWDWASTQKSPGLELPMPDPADGGPDFPVPEPAPFPPGFRCAFVTNWGTQNECLNRRGLWCGATNLVAKATRIWKMTNDGPATCSPSIFGPFARARRFTLRFVGGDRLSVEPCGKEQTCVQARSISALFTSNTRTFPIMIGPTYLELKRKGNNYFLVGQIPTVKETVRDKITVKAKNSVDSTWLTLDIVITAR